MIAIVDYGGGNVRSVANALAYLGLDAVVTADATVIDQAERLILPGVGAFGDVMAKLEARGLIEVLDREVQTRGKPFLGVCLGLQLLAKSSTEHGLHTGLGYLDAHVDRFDSEVVKAPLKVPHMGWNEVAPEIEHPMLAQLPPEAAFYFVHSYHIVCDDPGLVAATSVHGYRFASVVHRDNIFATQFHPEKSQDNGLQVLQNFASWTP
jgi:imidazole glycerol-phosphate synthase subunit HisH